MKNIMKIKTIFYFFMFVCSISATAQNLNFEIDLFPSLSYGSDFDAGYNGTGFSIEYQHPLTEKWNALGGIEYGFVGWGNQGLVELGVARKLVEKEKMSLQGEFILLNGLAWFRPKSLYVWGGEVNVVSVFPIRKKSSISLSLGLRYSQCPAYKDYGMINSYLDIPVKIGWRIGNI